MKKPLVSSKHPVARWTVKTPAGFRSGVVLLTALSGTTVVTGCALTDIKNPFGSQRVEQAVQGERHAPIYNVVDMQKIVQSSSPLPAGPIVSTSAPAPANVSLPPSLSTPMVQTKSDGYDYYAAAAAEQAKADAAGGSLGTLNPAPVKADAALHVRKPLLENPYQAQPSAQRLTQPAPAANLAPPSAPMAANAPSSPTPSLQPVPAVVSTGNVAEHPAENAATEAPAERPGFFARLFGSSDKKASPDGSDAPWKSRGEPVDDNAVSDNEKNAPSAALSSVPSAPAEFNAIKANRDQDIQNLRNDHANALAQKQALTIEPSQQQAGTPVEMPVQQPAPAVAPSQPAASYPADTQYPRSPRRGIDIMTQQEWDALQKAKTAQQSMPPQQPVIEQTPVVQQAPAVEQTPAQNVAPQPDAQPVIESPEPPKNGTNNLIMTPPPAQRDTPVPAEYPAPQNKQAPQSALPQQDVKPLAEDVADHSDNVTKTEVAEHRPSFFDRFFGGSPHSPEAADVAAAQEKTEAVVADDKDALKELTKPPIPIEAPVKKAELPPEENPAVIVAQKPDVKPAEEPSSSGDWLQSLVSDSQAKPIEAPVDTPVVAKDVPPQPEPKAEAVAVKDKAPVVAETPKDTDKGSSHLIGHMTDTSMMKLMLSPEDTTRPDIPAKTQEAASDSSADKADSKTKDKAIEVSQAAQSSGSPVGHPAFSARSLSDDTQMEAKTASQPDAVKNEEASAPHESFFSRLLGHKSSPEPDTAVAAPSPADENQGLASLPKPSGGEPVDVEALPKKDESAKEDKTVGTESKQQDADLEPVEVTPHRPSLLARLLSKKSSDKAADTSEAPAVEATAEKPSEATTSGLAEKSDPAAGASSVSKEAEERRATSTAQQTKDLFAPAETAAAKEPEPAVAAPAETTEAAPRRPSFFSRLLKKEPEVDSTSEVKSETTPVETAVVKAPEPAAQPSVETAAVKAPEPEVQAPVETTEATPQRPSFFSRLFSKQPKTDSDADKTDSTPVETDKTFGTVLPTDTTPPAEASKTNDTAPLPAATPLLTTSAPVQHVVTGDVKSGAAAAASAAAPAATDTPSSLPSPRLLDQVKLLPVSRYSARAKANKQNPDDN